MKVPDLLQPAVEGVRQNWRPMALVWVLAFGVAVAYYQAPGVAAGLVGLQSLKAAMGLWFAACAGFIAGGVLPEAAKVLTGTLAKDENVVGEAVFRGLVWSGLAVMVDVFYFWQAKWFGTAPNIQTLAGKTAVDMFIFAPILFVPYTVGMFLWRKDKFRASSLLKAWKPAVWKAEVLPTYVPNVCFWIVVLMAVYAMPTDLQYPMSALATACWSILFTFLQKRDLSTA